MVSRANLEVWAVNNNGFDRWDIAKRCPNAEQEGRPPVCSSLANSVTRSKENVDGRVLLATSS
jgi:hypothetical protein